MWQVNLMANSVRNGETTSQLLTAIRDASSFQEAVTYHETAPEPRFHETLYELMKKKGLSAKEMIRRTGLERSYFYHILNGQKNPGRNMVLRICFGLDLSLQEFNRMLRLAGLSELYSRRRRDAALIYAVTRQYSMEKANDLLNEAGEEPLYFEEKHE